MRHISVKELYMMSEKQSIVISTPVIDCAKVLSKVFPRAGINSLPLVETYWKVNKESTCFRIYRGAIRGFSDIKWYKDRNYKIYKLSATSDNCRKYEQNEAVIVLPHYSISSEHHVAKLTTYQKAAVDAMESDIIPYSENIAMNYER